MRMCTAHLKGVLDYWDGSVNMTIGDMYTFSMITGELFQYSNLQSATLAEVPGGRVALATSVPTSSINMSIGYTSVPLARWMRVGLIIQNLSNPPSIAPGTVVSNFDPTANTVTMSAPPAATILASDIIAFAAYFDYGPRFSRTKTKVQIGPQIDEMEVDMLVSEDDHITLGNTASMTWQEAIWHGLFDGGYMKLDRAFFTQNPGQIAMVCEGSITWFYGRISDVTIGRTKITIKVKSLLDLATIQMPRRLYQASCGWLFGHPGCDYDRVGGNNASGTSTGIGRQSVTCGTGSTQSMIVTGFVPTIGDIYDNGSIIGTSGQNNGYTRTLGMLNSNGYAYFLKPWVFPVVPNVDTFDLLPGCNHTLSRCNDFQNQARFGGFPYIPPPETAV